VTPIDASGAESRKEDVSRAVVTYYERSLETHGPTARGMDWKDETSQRMRYQVLTGVCELSGKTVHEIGAGAGHLYDHLKSCGIEAEYSGSDLSERMVEAALELHPGVSFEQCDARSLDGGQRWDVVLGSGLFHVKLDTPDREWLDLIEASIRGMFRACRQAIAFNAMSDRVDYRVPTLHYTSAPDMVQFCQQELSPHVVLRHDYPLHEYTIYVYREPQVA
jgi:hypothetical protein